MSLVIKFYVTPAQRINMKNVVKAQTTSASFVDAQFFFP